MSDEAKQEVEEARAKFEDALTVLSAWNAIAMILGGLTMAQRMRVTNAMTIMVDGYAQKKEGEPIGREVSRAIAEALNGRPMTEEERAAYGADLDLLDDAENAP